MCCCLVLIYPISVLKIIRFPNNSQPPPRVKYVSLLYLLFFLGSPPNSTEGANRRLVVYEHCIPLCESGDLQTEVAADIIGLLMLEVKNKKQTNNICLLMVSYMILYVS